MRSVVIVISLFILRPLFAYMTVYVSVCMLFNFIEMGSGITEVEVIAIVDL